MSRTEAGLAAMFVLALVLAWAALSIPSIAPVVNARSGGCPAEGIHAGRNTGSDGHGPAGFGLVLALLAIVVVGALVLFDGESSAVVHALSQPI